MKDNEFFEEMQNILYSANNRYVLALKKKLIDSAKNNNGNIVEIEFKDIYPYDYDGDYINNEVTLWMEANGIMWKWDDYCSGMGYGSYFIDLRSFFTNK